MRNAKEVATEEGDKPSVQQEEAREVLFEDVKGVGSQVEEALRMKHKKKLRRKKPKMGTSKPSSPLSSMSLINIAKNKQVGCSHMKSLSTCENEPRGNEPRVDIVTDVVNSNLPILGVVDGEKGTICKGIPTMVATYAVNKMIEKQPGIGEKC